MNGGSNYSSTIHFLPFRNHPLQIIMLILLENQLVTLQHTFSVTLCNRYRNTLSLPLWQSVSDVIIIWKRFCFFVKYYRNHSKIPQMMNSPITIHGHYSLSNHLPFSVLCLIMNGWTLFLLFLIEILKLLLSFTLRVSPRFLRGCSGVPPRLLRLSFGKS